MLPLHTQANVRGVQGTQILKVLTAPGGGENLHQSRTLPNLARDRRGCCCADYRMELGWNCVA